MRQEIIYAFISMAAAGVTSVIAKHGLRNVSGDAGLFVRTMFVALFVTLNLIVFGYAKELQRLTRTDVLFLAGSAVTTSISWIFYYKAIKTGNVSEVALIDKASIIITLLLSFLLLREPLTIKVMAGAVLILTGLFIISWK
ncbi:MAG: EamA family transporter [Chitinophagales bacterium]|nr:EamA family transporter [Chitinophagales bacterium]MDW8419243.1 EamA family transporter [Chitinophagales bacterium]